MTLFSKVHALLARVGGHLHSPILLVIRLYWGYQFFLTGKGKLTHLDRAAAFYNPGTYVPARGGETYLEITYQYQVTPWWQLQPDIQYVFNPGGGIANPNAPLHRVGDELVLGLRTVIQF